jgi:uncharacterized protein YjiS (DUF1127 family)
MSNASIAMGPLADAAEARRAARAMVPLAAWHALAGAASRIAAWRARRRRVKHTVIALSALSDRMLRDIGVEPGEIAQAATRACRG